MQRLNAATLLVRDYDQAIAWFVDMLAFRLIEDVGQGEGKRWVKVAPQGGGTALLLARAVGGQADAVGRQAGGRVGFFLEVSDFDAAHARMAAAGVRFAEAPRHELYGAVAVFEDLYGNRWDLLEARTPLVHLIAGSTGAGKTTFAMSLAEEIGAVRFSIDEWITTLFEADRPEPIEFAWMMERIDRCEALIWAHVLQLTARGVPAILDLGFTTAAHRARAVSWAREANLPVRLHRLDVSAQERWARVERRNAERGGTFRLEVTREMFDFVEGLWEPPTLEEMAAAGD